MIGQLTCAALLVAVSVVFFACSENQRIGVRMLASAAAVSFVVTFLLGAVSSNWVKGATLGGLIVWLLYVAQPLVGLGLIAFSIWKYQGPKYLHALHLFTLAVGAMLWFLGIAEFGYL